MAALFLIVSFHGGAESFRGEVVAIEEIDAEAERSATLALGEVFLVRPDPSEPFIVGLELDLDVSGPPARYAGEFALQVYGNVAGPHISGLRDLEGRRIALVPITAPRRQYIILPTRLSDPPDGTADDTVLDRVELQTDEWFALQLVPLMKNLPQDPTSIALPISASPRLATVGGLLVEIESLLATDADIEGDETYTLLLDGDEIPAGELLELQPGIYLLELRSTEFVERSENVGIERGRVTRMTVELERPKASVRFSVPTIAEILVNGNRVANDATELDLEPGPHTFLIRLGDFSVSRQVFLNPEETYEIGVELDFFVRSD